MNSFQLKMFAIITMLIDHTGIILISQTNDYKYLLMFRAIGRLAFPIFAFLIVEGYYHTRNVKKYLRRLFVFAFISEIPFDVALYQYHSNTDFISDIKFILKDPSYLSVVIERLFLCQNVFFTLFLGLLLIALLDWIDKKYLKKDFRDIIISNTIEAFFAIMICLLAFLCRSDYDMAGIFIIAAFYLFRDSIILMGISLFVISGTMLCDVASYLKYGNLLNVVSILAVLAIIPIAMYNHKKGKDVKYFFYIFYPAHFICLFLIKVLL